MERTTETNVGARGAVCIRSIREQLQHAAIACEGFAERGLVLLLLGFAQEGVGAGEMIAPGFLACALRQAVGSLDEQVGRDEIIPPGHRELGKTRRGTCLLGHLRLECCDLIFEARLDAPAAIAERAANLLQRLHGEREITRGERIGGAHLQLAQVAVVVRRAHELRTRFLEPAGQSFEAGDSPRAARSLALDERHDARFSRFRDIVLGANARALISLGGRARGGRDIRSGLLRRRCRRRRSDCLTRWLGYGLRHLRRRRRCGAQLRTEELSQHRRERRDALTLTYEAREAALKHEHRHVLGETARREHAIRAGLEEEVDGNAPATVAASRRRQRAFEAGLGNLVIGKDLGEIGEVPLELLLRQTARLGADPDFACQLTDIAIDKITSAARPQRRDKMHATAAVLRQSCNARSGREREQCRTRQPLHGFEDGHRPRLHRFPTLSSCSKKRSIRNALTAESRGAFGIGAMA